MPLNEQLREEMNYLQLIRKIFSFKRRLLIFTLVGMVFGILIAFTSPKEYTSSSLVILEDTNQGGQFSQMGALAGLTGISLPQMQRDQAVLSAELFPDVIHSRDFLLGIMKKSFYFQTKGQEMTLEEYYTLERPGNIVSKTLNFIISIPSRIIGIFSSDESLVTADQSEKSESMEDPYVSVSSSEMFTMNQLKDRILIDNKMKLIELNVSMPEALIAAKVNAMVLERLIAYITEYKTVKQKGNLEFIEERVKESEEKFQQAQMKLASFRDTNQGIVSRRAMTKEDQLQFEFNIAFNIYNSMKQELEQAAIQLKKDTPIFTLMEKASVPLGPSKPNKPLIIVFSMFLGFFVGILYATYQILLSQISN